MKLLLLPVLMAFFAVAQVYCEEIDPKEEVDYWTSSNQIQVRTLGACLFSFNCDIHRQLLSVKYLNQKHKCFKCSGIKFHKM